MIWVVNLLAVILDRPSTTLETVEFWPSLNFAGIGPRQESEKKSTQACYAMSEWMSSDMTQYLKCILPERNEDPEIKRLWVPKRHTQPRSCSPVKDKSLGSWQADCLIVRSDRSVPSSQRNYLAQWGANEIPGCAKNIAGCVFSCHGTWQKFWNNRIKYKVSTLRIISACGASRCPFRGNV